MTGSAEFTTWVVLAFAAAFAGICAIFSTTTFALVASAVVGGVAGYFAEHLGRDALNRYFEPRRRP